MKISHLDLHMLMCEEADDDMGPVLLMDPDRASGLMPKRCWAADAPARAEAALDAMVRMEAEDTNADSNKRRSAIRAAVQHMTRDLALTCPVIPSKPFERLAKEVFKDLLQQFESEDELQFVRKLGSDAFLALQVAMEASAEAIMADMALLAQHSHRPESRPEHGDREAAASSEPPRPSQQSGTKKRQAARPAREDTSAEQPCSGQ